MHLHVHVLIGPNLAGWIVVMTLPGALPGDVNPGQVESLAERYFGTWRNATVGSCSQMASLSSADSIEGLPIPKVILRKLGEYQQITLVLIVHLGRVRQ